MARRQWDLKHAARVKEIQRKSQLKSRYGLTPEGYDHLYDQQHGRCVLCKKHQSELKGRLVVDHDHTTGRIRGLLCSNCNRSLGFFCDSPIRLREAAAYLERG